MQSSVRLLRALKTTVAVVVLSVKRVRTESMKSFWDQRLGKSRIEISASKVASLGTIMMSISFEAAIIWRT